MYYLLLCVKKHKEWMKFDFWQKVHNERAIARN